VNQGKLKSSNRNSWGYHFKHAIFKHFLPWRRGSSCSPDTSLDRSSLKHTRVHDISM